MHPMLNTAVKAARRAGRASAGRRRLDGGLAIRHRDLGAVTQAVGAVNHIIVNQRGGVDHFDHDAQIDAPSGTALATARLMREARDESREEFARRAGVDGEAGCLSGLRVGGRGSLSHQGISRLRCTRIFTALGVQRARDAAQQVERRRARHLTAQHAAEMALRVGGGQWRAHASSRMPLRSVPIASTTISHTSPGFMNTGGLRA